MRIIAQARRQDASLPLAVEIWISVTLVHPHVVDFGVREPQDLEASTPVNGPRYRMPEGLIRISKPRLVCLLEVRREVSTQG